MSEFLMVVPSGWVEIQDAQSFVDRHTEAQLFDLIGSNQMAGVEARLQDDGLIASDAVMSDFRMFRDGSGYRIWVKLG